MLFRSCLSMVEAMSAQCVCVHPNFAALPEVSGSLTYMYPGDSNPNVHANVFASVLGNAIERVVQDTNLQQILQFSKTFADSKYSWNVIIPQWESLIDSLKKERANRPPPPPPSKEVFKIET